MNGLVRDGAVILGGPLEGTADVVLVMRAATADEARGWLAADPWAVQDLLRVTPRLALDAPARVARLSPP